VALHHSLYLIRKYPNHIRYQLWRNSNQRILWTVS